MGNLSGCRENMQSRWVVADADCACTDSLRARSTSATPDTSSQEDTLKLIEKAGKALADEESPFDRGE